MLALLNIRRDTLVELIRLSIPMVISNGAITVMIFFDRFFLSYLSSTHMAASLSGGVSYFFSTSLIVGLLAYGNALVAQYYGAGDYGKCSRVVTQGFFLALAAIPIVVLLWLYLGEVFFIMGHAPEQAELAKQYFQTLTMVSFLLFLKVSLQSFFTGVGRTKTVMVAELLGVAINIPVSWVLIFGHFGFSQLGIVGAALGTVLGTVLSLVTLSCFYFSRQNRLIFKIKQSLVLDWSVTQRYLRLGLPSATDSFLTISAFNLFLLLFQGYGLVESSAVAIVLNWSILCFIPLLGLNVSIISLVGRRVGANKLDKINEVIRAGMFLGLGYGLMFALVFLCFSDVLINLFLQVGENVDAIFGLAKYMMFLLVLLTLLDAVILVSSGVLRGAGDTPWLMRMSVSLHWLMLLSQLVIIKVLVIDARVAWFAFILFACTLAGSFLWRLLGNRWRDPKQIASVMSS